MCMCVCCDHARNISAIPIVDEENRVIDLYHRTDVTFIAVAGDVESTMSNLNMIVGDLLEQRKGKNVTFILGEMSYGGSVF